jgi:hypothetical protein
MHRNCMPIPTFLYPKHWAKRWDNLTVFQTENVCVSGSVVDRHRFDADPDLDPTVHF